MKKALFTLLAVIALAFASLLFMLFLWPRPADTTEARVFEGDASKLDHCALPVLDETVLSAKQIPKAYTPGCGWTELPMPILANCTEPLAQRTIDMRGLWLAHTGKVGHVERIEQCGDRVVVVSAGIIHDFHTDGTLANGSRDVESPLCINTFVSIDYDGEVMTFHPFGLPITVAKRWMEGDELVWTYPAIEGQVRMKRICKLPEEARGGV